MGAESQQQSRQGLAEYRTAFDFMLGADALIRAYETGTSAPRSLVNLTFLALEISLKAHLKHFTEESKKGHNLTDLYEAILHHPRGRTLISQLGESYELFLGHIAGKVVGTRKYDSLEDLMGFLTKETFISWRYLYEKTEDLDEPLQLPFLNLYLATWMFTVTMGKSLDSKTPRCLEYKKMPIMFEIKTTTDNPRGTEWETTFIDGVILGQGRPD